MSPEVKAPSWGHSSCSAGGGGAPGGGRGGGQNHRQRAQACWGPRTGPGRAPTDPARARGDPVLRHKCPPGAGCGTAADCLHGRAETVLPGVGGVSRDGGPGGWGRGPRSERRSRPGGKWQRCVARPWALGLRLLAQAQLQGAGGSSPHHAPPGALTLGARCTLARASGWWPGAGVVLPDRAGPGVWAALRPGVLP